MGLKKSVSDILNRSGVYRQMNYLRKIYKKHRGLEERHIGRTGDKIYYIIRFNSPMHCGWTVWERVVLYGSIYAEDHGMIPVVDMKNQKNIYQEDGDFGRINTWDLYYEQPAEVKLEDALASGNYVLADPSSEWFSYVRMRKHGKMDDDFLREKYAKFIRLREDTQRICDGRLKELLYGRASQNDVRMFGIVVRGTDYRKYSHPIQPNILSLVEEAKRKFEEYYCDYYFVATEDFDILQKLMSLLPKEKIITFDAGNVKDIGEELVGEYLRRNKSGRDVSLDYLTTLYILNKCCCIVGGYVGLRLLQNIGVIRHMNTAILST